MGTIDVAEAWITTDPRPSYIEVSDVWITASEKPVAVASADQSGIEPFSTVTITGAASTGPVSDWTWTQTAGTTATLEGTGAVRTFKAPGSAEGETLTFSLTVTDGTVTSDPDTVDIEVMGATELAVIDGALVPIEMRWVYTPPEPQA